MCRGVGSGREQQHPPSTSSNGRDGLVPMRVRRWKARTHEQVPAGSGAVLPGVDREGEEELRRRRGATRRAEGGNESSVTVEVGHRWGSLDGLVGR
jgi:hypothetical protein